MQRMPIYHGRKVLAALFMAGFMVYGGGLYCFVLLVPPLTEEFHWSRAATGGVWSGVRSGVGGRGASYVWVSDTVPPRTLRRAWHR